MKLRPRSDAASMERLEVNCTRYGVLTNFTNPTLGEARNAKRPQNIRRFDQTDTKAGGLRDHSYSRVICSMIFRNSGF